MSALEEATFNAPNDQLVRTLLREERVQRWDLFKSFRQEMDDYRARLDCVTGDVYHELPVSEGSCVALVLGRTVVGSGVGPYEYLAVSQEKVEDEIRENILTTYAIARHHYALWWSKSHKRTYEKPPVGLEIETRATGPSSRFEATAARGRHAYRTRRVQQFAYTPELHWHPEPGEQIEVRQVLEAAIGLVSTLGTSTYNPEDTTISKRFAFSAPCAD